MMKASPLWAAPLFALLVGAGGCSNTVRYLTTMSWMTTPGGASAPAAAATPAAAAAPAAPSSGASGASVEGGTRTLYVTYWEGTCSSGFFGIGKGCSLGDSKIRRCNVTPDNLLQCQDELEANQSFARKK